jgi:type III pantothenate kinase
MILELDAGNTRIKWRIRQQKESGEWVWIANGSVFAQQKAPSVIIELGRQFENLPLDQITHLLVSSVRGEGFKVAFSALMTEKWHLHPEYAVVTETAAGVHNGYRESAKLGVDRWLAMVAAYNEVRNACFVVDCGTTITVDLVSAEGRHIGGYIVPGLHLMREALENRSRALASADAAWDSVAPGDTTAAAIHNGILAMALGFLRDLQQSQVGRQSCWFLAGGDASVLAPWLDWECRLVPDLVMDGLVLTMLQSKNTG